MIRCSACGKGIPEHETRWKRVLYLGEEVHGDLVIQPREITGYYHPDCCIQFGAEIFEAGQDLIGPYMQRKNYEDATRNYLTGILSRQ
jgi:hypothetical protein